MFGDVIVQKRYKWEFGYGLSFTRIAVISTKKELLVLEYIDRSNIAIFYRLNNCAITPTIHLTLALYCYILLIN